MIKAMSLIYLYMWVFYNQFLRLNFSDALTNFKSALLYFQRFSTEEAWSEAKEECRVVKVKCLSAHSSKAFPCRIATLAMDFFVFSGAKTGNSPVSDLLILYIELTKNDVHKNKHATAYGLLLQVIDLILFTYENEQCSQLLCDDLLDYLKDENNKKFLLALLKPDEVENRAEAVCARTNLSPDAMPTLVCSQEITFLRFFSTTASEADTREDRLELQSISMSDTTQTQQPTPRLLSPTGLLQS